jgi:hypothetical protein
MNAEDVIKEVQENLSEWIEMSEDPATFVAGVLANKVIRLKDRIDFLEKRLKYVQR